MKISRVSAAVTMMAVLIGVLNVKGADPLPNDLPSGIQVWNVAGIDVATDIANTIPATDGDLARSWDGQTTPSYILYDYATSTYSNSPTYIASAAAGLPAVRFGVTGNQYDIMRSANIAAGQYVGSIFVVFQPHANITRTSNPQALVDLTAGTGKEAINLGASTGSLANEIICINIVGTNAAGGTINCRYAWQDNAGTESITSNSVHFLSVIYDATGQKYDIYLDGTKVSNFSYGLAPIMPLLKINYGHHGAASNPGLHAYQGMISEVIMFDSALDETDQATVNDYLNEKYDPPMGTVVIVH